MRLEPDLLLEGNRGRRLKGLDRLLLLLAKKLLDGVAHAVGFTGGLGFGLDPEPGFVAWGIANVFHASSNIPYDERGSRTARGRCCIIGGGQRAGKAESAIHAYIYSSILRALPHCDFVNRCAREEGSNGPREWASRV